MVRNAEQVKKRVREHRVRLRCAGCVSYLGSDMSDDLIISREHESVEAMAQDDGTHFRGRSRLLDLRSQIERWCCIGSEVSGWNQMAEGSLREAERLGDLALLQPVLSKFEEKKVAGEYLLIRLNTWTVDDYPVDISDAILAFKTRSELFVHVARVLGFTERWIGLLSSRLERPLQDNLTDFGHDFRDEESLIEAELLSDGRLSS